MTKLKESILNYVTKGDAGYTCSASNNVTDTITRQIITTTSAITVYSDAYIYGIFQAAVQAIGVFRAFAYKRIYSQSSNKEQVKEQKQHIKAPE